MKQILTLSVVVWLFSSGFLAADPESKAKDSPSPESGFPQIIQRDDYPTIEFLEALYRSLAGISPPRDPDQFGEVADCTLEGEALTFRSKADPRKEVTVRLRDGHVELEKQTFANPETTKLVSTLLKVLAGTSSQKVMEVRFAQYKTRSYERRTVLELAVGERVVVVDGLSNGPTNEERLYILDLIDRAEALLWRPPGTTGGAPGKSDQSPGR